jgi:hypothetical protein
MPKFSITTEEVWPHKVYYTITAKTLEAAMVRIRAGEAEHYEQRIGEIAGDCVVGVHEIKQNGKPLPVPVHLIGECAVADGKKTSPEFRLAEFWRSKAGLEYSEFDRLLGEESPAHAKKPSTRSTARAEPRDYDMNPDLPERIERGSTAHKAYVARRLYDDIDMTREYVARGLPLSRREYYMALAMGYIMGDRPYEEFFQTRWYETEDVCGFGSYEDNKTQ